MSTSASGCKIGGGVPPSRTPRSAPWHGTDRAGDKSRLWRYVRWESDGVPLSEAAKDVLDADTGSSDYQLARRFYQRHDAFLTAKRGKHLWVYPTIEAIFLDSQQKAKRKNARGGRDSPTGDERPDKTGHDAVEDQDARDRAKSMLGKYRVCDGSNDRLDVRSELQNELATYRRQIDGKFNLFKHRNRDEYIALPYSTRFNDADKAGKSRDRLRTALDRAHSRFNRATMVTLTVPPFAYDSLLDAAEALSENVSRFNQWLEYQVGYHPAKVTSWEVQDTGQLHAHIVLFGVRAGDGDTTTGEPVLSGQDVRDYWNNTRDIGRQIAVQTVDKARDGWVLSHGDGDVSLEYYLGKFARDLVDLADRDAGELEGDSVDYWKHAVLWALNKRYVTVSPELRPESDDPDLPPVTTWEFVGTARYRDVPVVVRERTTWVGVPPPPD